MILSVIEFVPELSKRKATLEILQFVADGLRNNRECSSCSLYEGLDQDRTILYLEQWESEQGFHRHLQSSLYRRVLNAIDLARTKPRVNFYEVAGTRSMELVEELRCQRVER